MARKKQKTPQNSTSKSSEAKDSTWEEYYNVIAHQMAPSNSEAKKRLAITLVEWAKKITKAVDIEDFTDSVGIPIRTYYNWLPKCPELFEANEFAKRRIASVRIQGATHDGWNWSACRYVLPFFGDKYREREKEIAELTRKPDQAAVGGNEKYILIEKFPDSDMVAEKK